MFDVPKEGPKTSLVETYIRLPFFKRRLVYRKLSRDDQMRLDRHLRERKKRFTATVVASSLATGEDKSEALQLSPEFFDHVQRIIDDPSLNTGSSTRTFLKGKVDPEGYSNV